MLRIRQAYLLQFKEISIAYQVLSDKDLRHKYNEFGQKNGGGGGSEPAGGFQDPEEVFGKMFGGDRFEDWIGTISIGKSRVFNVGRVGLMFDRKRHEGGFAATD